MSVPGKVCPPNPGPVAAVKERAGKANPYQSFPKSAFSLGTTDHSIHENSHKPLITLLALPSITARSGQSAKAVSGENTYISGYKVDTKTEQEVAVSSTCLSGTSFEVDPVIGTDGATMDINLLIEHALEEPVLTEHTIVGPVSGKDLQVQSAKENRANITTSLTIQTGQTRLLGSIPAKNTEFLLLIFLYAEIVSAQP